MPSKPTALTERIGVQKVGLIFVETLNWYFREQAVSDFGIDAEVEVADANGQPGGKLIALQIKSGESFFRNKKNAGYTYYGEPRHLDYWLSHSLPVFLIIHNPVTDIVLYQRIERHLIRKGQKGWSIVIPKANILNERAKEALSSGVGTDKQSIRRYRFASDRAEMEKFRGKTTFFSFDFWVNKTLGLRSIKVFYDRYDKQEPDDEIGVWGTTHSPDTVMVHFFPWLSYEYACIIDADEQSGEVETHIIEVNLNKAAKRFLKLEAFFDDPNDPEPPERPSLEEDLDEDELMEQAYRYALSRDNS